MGTEVTGELQLGQVGGLETGQASSAPQPPPVTLELPLLLLGLHPQTLQSALRLQSAVTNCSMPLSLWLWGFPSPQWSPHMDPDFSTMLHYPLVPIHHPHSGHSSQLLLFKLG